MNLIERFGVVMGILLTLVVVALVVGCVVGYVNNIIKLVHCDWQFSAEEGIRLVGVFVGPVGMIMGYVDFPAPATQ